MAAIVNGASPAGKVNHAGTRARARVPVCSAKDGARQLTWLLKKGGLVELRYLGFDQKLNTRTYRFMGITSGEPALQFIVTADLGLFLSNRVAIQEGPALSANKLASDLQDQANENHELTSEDLHAHVRARALADERKAGARRNRAR